MGKLKDKLIEAGKKVNPKAAESLRKADSILKQSYANEEIQAVIRKHIPKVGMGAGTALYMAGIPLPLVLGGAGGYYTLKTVYEATKNPAIREVAGRTFKAAAMNNGALVDKLLRRVDKEFSKLDINQKGT